MKVETPDDIPLENCPPIFLASIPPAAAEAPSPKANLPADLNTLTPLLKPDKFICPKLV